MNGIRENKTSIQRETHQRWLDKVHDQLDAAACRNETAERYEKLTLPQRKAVFVMGNAMADGCVDQTMMKLEGKDIFTGWPDLTPPQRRTIAQGMEAIRQLARVVPARYRPGDIGRHPTDH